MSEVQILNITVAIAEDEEGTELIVDVEQSFAFIIGTALANPGYIEQFLDEIAEKIHLSLRMKVEMGFER